MEFKMMTDLDAILPSGIEFNYDELKSGIDEILRKYEGKGSCDSSNYRQRKEERAALNRLGKQIDDVRKSVKKRLLAVMEDGSEDDPSFSAKMSSLVESVNKATERIDSAIKEYEEGVKNEKRAEIVELVSKTVGESEMPEWAKESAWFRLWSEEQMCRKKDCWLNSGYSMDLVSYEVRKEVERCAASVNSVEYDLFSNGDSELTKIKGRNALARAFLVEDAMMAVKANREEEAAAAKREAERREAELASMATRIDTSAVEKEPEAVETGVVIYSCEMRFVGTLEALCNLKEYLGMNKDITYTVVKGMEPCATKVVSK